MLQASPRCKSLIEHFETMARLLPSGMVQSYPDPGSLMGKRKYPLDGPDISKGAPWTIGFGSTGKDVTRGTIWTVAQCEARFDDRLNNYFAPGVRFLLGNAPTTQNQFDSLVSFAYNVGLDIDDDKLAEGLGDSTLLRYHLAGKYQQAADEFPKWCKSGGVIMNGLIKRRAAERALYLGVG